MRTTFYFILLTLLFLLLACGDTVKDDENNKTPIVDVEKLIDRIKATDNKFPVNEIAKLNESDESMLFKGLENTTLKAEDVLSIAIIRKNQGKYELALHWLGLNIEDSERFLDIRYRKAEILYLLGKFKESYVLCKIQVLPDEKNQEMQKLFDELASRIESEYMKEE